MDLRACRPCFCSHLQEIICERHSSPQKSWTIAGLAPRKNSYKISNCGLASHVLLLRRNMYLANLLNHKEYPQVRAYWRSWCEPKAGQFPPKANPIGKPVTPGTQFVDHAPHRVLCWQGSRQPKRRPSWLKAIRSAGSRALNRFTFGCELAD
jgi:hypothetical protein